MKIIELPKYKELKQYHKELTNQYIKLIEEKEDILYKKKNYLEALYLSYFGYLAKNKLNLTIEIRKIKRKISLIQAYINRNEKVNIEEIEEILQQEMLIFQEQLKELNEKIQSSEKLINSEKLTDDELKEVKKIFRALAKKLHPDINKTTEKSKSLWNRVIKAYDRNDLPTLRLLSNIISEDNQQQDYNSIEELEKDIQALEQKITDIFMALEEVKLLHPFNLEDKLMDEEWVDIEKENLVKQVNELNHAKEEYLNKLQTIERLNINE